MCDHIYHHLLEVSRVCSKKSGGSNFNIFYSLLNGAPNDMKEELCLKNDLFAVYSVTILNIS